MLKRIIITILAICGWVVLKADENGSFEFQGLKRTYIVHTPPNYNGRERMALIINMHGFAANAKTHVRMSQMNPKADSEGFIIVYPNGTGWPKRWNAGYLRIWNEKKKIDDVAFINTLIDTMIATYAIDTLRIYAAGFSNGGMMAHRLGCELSHRIAAIASVSGELMVKDCEPSRPMPVIHIHPRHDPVLPYYGDKRRYPLPPIDSVMLRWARLDSCNAGPDSLRIESGALSQVWTNSSTGVEVVLWTVEDGNHAWPGGEGIALPTVNRPSKEINANDLIWEFFLCHPMAK